ncbi:MAG: hypothetical protein Q9160_000168 [Pyrenula sp. 1 TL-2023]
MKSVFVLTALVLTAIASTVPSNSREPDALVSRSGESVEEHDFTQESKASLKRSSDLSHPTKRVLDNALSNGNRFPACANTAVSIANLALVTNWPHWPDQEVNVYPAAQAIYDKLISNLPETNDVYEGTINAGLGGGQWVLKMMTGSSMSEFAPESFLLVLRDAVARLYEDRRGGMQFRIVDSLGRVIWYVSLLMYRSS